MLLQLHPLSMQLLSLAGTAIAIKARWNAFAEGRLAPFLLMGSALLVAGDCTLCLLQI